MSWNDSIKVSRQTLYNDLWELGITRVANKYNTSIKELKQICEYYHIPKPDNVYWGKLHSGQDVSDLKPTLEYFAKEEVVILEKRKFNRTTEVKSLNSGLDKNGLTDNDIRVYEHERFKERLLFLSAEEIRKIEKIAFSVDISKTGRLHNRVVKLKNSIERWLNRARQDRRNYYDYSTREYINEPRFAMDVSKSSLPRLYSLLDIIFKTFELLGVEVTENCTLKFGGDEVRFDIVEKLNQVPHEITKKEARDLIIYEDAVKNNKWAVKPQIRKYDKVPTGIFRIKFSQRKFIKDGEDKKLENLMPEIIASIYEEYRVVKEEREAREEKHRLWLEEEKRKELLIERINKEKGKTRALLNTIEDYKLAQDIRTYANILATQSKDDNLISWILAKADWIDPLVSKPDELLGERNHKASAKDKQEALEAKRYL
ncbi:hypothetical protein [uncultured Veillonella sp.]|uniref:hypothetical protein n=1 Tax=uncultured Veillonella sp. TaxID=159268 RepID=UPI0025F0E25C|nr:hypothetical protein [uncultured Veillonella sp.]MDY3974246.1 hypothetical protein [Veillonella caviae]